MSIERSQVDIPLLSNFIKSLEGVDYLVVVLEEGFPIAFEGIDKERAEAASAIAVDITQSGLETLRGFVKKKAENVLVELENGEAIDIVSARNLLLLLGGRRDPVKEASTPIKMHLEGRKFICPHCEADLTLRHYICPHCGSTIPYTARICPRCKTSVDVKECSECGGKLDLRGNPVNENAPEEKTPAAKEPKTEAKRKTLVAGLRVALLALAVGLAAAIAISDPVVTALAAGAGGLVGSVVDGKE